MGVLGGYLRHKGKSLVMDTWKKRYFVLDHFVFAMYKSNEDFEDITKPAVLSIKRNNIRSIAPDTRLETQFSFWSEVESNIIHWVLEAPSEAIRDKWVNTLTEGLRRKTIIELRISGDLRKRSMDVDLGKVDSNLSDEETIAETSKEMSTIGWRKRHFLLTGTTLQYWTQESHKDKNLPPKVIFPLSLISHVQCHPDDPSSVQFLIRVNDENEHGEPAVVKKVYEIKGDPLGMGRWIRGLSPENWRRNNYENMCKPSGKNASKFLTSPKKSGQDGGKSAVSSSAPSGFAVLHFSRIWKNNALNRVTASARNLLAEVSELSRSLSSKRFPTYNPHDDELQMFVVDDLQSHKKPLEKNTSSCCCCFNRKSLYRKFHSLSEEEEQEETNLPNLSLTNLEPIIEQDDFTLDKKPRKRSQSLDSPESSVSNSAGEGTLNEERRNTYTVGVSTSGAVKRKVAENSHEATDKVQAISNKDCCL